MERVEKLAASERHLSGDRGVTPHRLVQDQRGQGQEHGHTRGRPILRDATRREVDMNVLALEGIPAGETPAFGAFGAGIAIDFGRRAAVSQRA